MCTISLVCHNEGRQRAKLLFTQARVGDENWLKSIIPAAHVSRRSGPSREPGDWPLKVTLEEHQSRSSGVDQQPYWIVVQLRFHDDKWVAGLK